jgi:dipeptidyl aminopeptidase/acylaminoacyl peptidase
MQQTDILDALLTIPQLRGSAVSRDGSWVAWTWFGVGQAAEVYAAPTDGEQEPVQLTDTPEETFLVSWTPDSRAVIVGQDQSGDERVQLFRVSLDRPREMEPLTEPEPPYFLQGGMLCPDGRTLIYGMNYDVERGQEIEPTWIYRHDLETGERAPISCPEKPGYLQPWLNNAGTHVIYDRQDLAPAGSQVWLCSVDGSEDREILNFGAAVKTTGTWFPDGKRVLFLTEAGDHRKLGIWHMKDGSITWLLDDQARNIEYAYAPRGDGDVVVAVEVREARPHVFLLDLERGEEIPFPAIPGSFIPQRPVGVGEWVGYYYRSTQPGDVIRMRPGDLDSIITLSRIWDRTPIRPQDLTPAEDFRWRSVDGLEIQGWLYRAPRARGTIALIHGGPTVHSQDAFNTEVQFFVGEGFNVFSPNYRGSTGFSLAFEESIKEDGWGGREQEDIRAGIEALIAEGIAQPGKVGITGTSYGGYSSWCAVTRFPPETLAASAPICGMTDLVIDYETTRPDLRPYSEQMMGGSPAQVPEKYRRASPINFIENIRGKLLIVQGMRDPNVTPENVRAVREALDRAGIEYEVLAFEDEGHGIHRPANQRILYRRLADFFTAAFVP